MYSWQPVLSGEIHDAGALVQKETIRQHVQRARLLL
jgi:hypothetical protein